MFLHRYLSHRLLKLSFIAAAICAFTDSNAQYSATDYAATPSNIIPVNDGFQNINPFADQLGKRLYFTKVGHPSNVGTKLSQDIWYSEKKDNKWSECSNVLPGLNTPLNELIIGSGGNGMLYVISYTDGNDNQLKVIKAFRIDGSKYVLDHEIALPNVHLLSEFFGFFIAHDESYVLMSMKGENSFGKEDLYVALKTKSGWSNPIHLGARINTIGFEMSPFMSKDGRHLYFSSEGHAGLGSADIYMAYRNDESWQNWSKAVNLGPNINTEKFEAYFSLNETEREAYFISHRNGQFGQVYSISYSNTYGESSPSAHPAASGFIRMEKLPAMNIKLNLLDENDRVIQSVTTNSEGFFNLQSFLPDRDYKIAIDEDIRQELKSADIFLTNDLGDNMVFMNEKELGIFGFKVLSGQQVKEVSELEKLANKGAIVDKPTTISGKVATYGTLSKNVTLNVVDEKNKVVQSITTDDQGFFSFNTNATEKSYFLSVEGDMNGLVDVYEIYLTNDNDNEDIVVTKTDKHLFEFRALNKGVNYAIKELKVQDAAMPDHLLAKYGFTSVDRTDISGYLKLDKLPIIGSQIYLMDENDKVLSTAVTNDEGEFVFSDLLKEGSYSLQLKSDQEQELDKREIFLARNPDEVLFYLNDDRAGVFAFKKLSKSQPITLYSLRTEVEQGAVVWEKNSALKGKFEYNKLPKSGVKIELLDEAENVIQITNVDENGEFEFKNYQVNKNYFISVSGDEGLSDIYEVYLSGQQKNVLVNNTNKFVFAFKVLPTQDILLSDAFERDESDAALLTDRHSHVQNGLKMEDGRRYFEFDLNDFKSNDLSPLTIVAADAALGKKVIVRLSKEKSIARAIELETIAASDYEPIIQELVKLGVSKDRITARGNGSDQVIMVIIP